MQHNGQTICFYHERKQSRYRDKDWEAFFEGGYAGSYADFIGYGATQKDSMQNLIEQVEMI